jgi:hypothetical protein
MLHRPHAAGRPAGSCRPRNVAVGHVGAADELTAGSVVELTPALALENRQAVAIHWDSR